MSGWAYSLAEGHPELSEWTYSLAEGHPEVSEWTYSLAEGHPEVSGRAYSLAEGHPEVSGWAYSLAERHPAVAKQPKPLKKRGFLLKQPFSALFLGRDELLEFGQRTQDGEVRVLTRVLEQIG